MKKNIEVVSDGGLQCDNPKCDWTDMTILIADFDAWLNKPCPKCGENVLTDVDYNNAKQLHAMIDFINTLSEEELDEFNKLYGMSIESMKSHPVFGQIEGIQSVTDGEVITRVSSHETIKIESIKNVTTIFKTGKFLDKSLPPVGTDTNYGKIMSYNANGSVNVGDTILHTETGDCHQDTLCINNVKLLDCPENAYWIN